MGVFGLLRHKIFSRHCRSERQRSSGFTLIELIVASLIVTVVMLIAWSGLISLMNMSAKAEARTLRKIEINRALDFLTDELRTARNINATMTNQVDGDTDIADLLTTEGFDLQQLGDYGDLSLYLEIPVTQTPPDTCPAGGPSANLPPPEPSTFDRIIYDVRPSTSEWLGPKTLMRYGRIKNVDGSFDPCAVPIASDPIADALSDDAGQTPACPGGILTGGAGFYACQQGDRTNLIFQHTLVDTSVAEIASGATSRLQSIQPKQLANVGCQNKENLRALNSDRLANLRILNQRSNPVKVYNLDAAGEPQAAELIEAQSTWEKQTFESHPWIVTDATNQCLAVYVPDVADSLVILEPEDGAASGPVGGAEDNNDSDLQNGDWDDDEDTDDED